MNVKDEERLWQLFLVFSKEDYTATSALRDAREYLDYFNSQTKEPKVVKPRGKTLEERKRDFRSECDRWLGVYGRVMIDDFYEYWAESNPAKTKMKWEMQSTFDIDRRLKNWKKMDVERGTNKYTYKPRKQDEDYLNFIKDNEKDTDTKN